MRDANAIVAIYDAQADIEADMRALGESSVDLEHVSVLGPAERPQEEPVAYYQMPGRIGCWGRNGMFWSSVWAALAGWALVSLPEYGPILVAGPLAMWIVAALDNAALFSGLSAVGAGLYSLGIPRSRIMRCEAALHRNMYLMVVHGAVADVSRAGAILKERRRRAAAFD